MKTITLEAKKQSETDTWQADTSGRRYRVDSEGRRRYTLPNVERILPLGQYFQTELYDQYQGCRLDQFQIEFDDKLGKAKQLARGYLQEWEQIKPSGMGFYLWSDTPGSGKSMLSCCILNELSERYGVTTQAINTVNLLKRVKNTFDDPGSSEKSILNPVTAVDVLLLDDIGAERESDWAEEQLYFIINCRWNKRKPTFFTSNMPINELPYHGRLKSRINAATSRINMPERDIRDVVAKSNRNNFLNEIGNTDE